MRAFLNRRLIAPLLGLLRQGVTPHELAFSLALGTVVGLVPVLGISTVLATLAALALRLNRPLLRHKRRPERTKDVRAATSLTRLSPMLPLDVS